MANDMTAEQAIEQSVMQDEIVHLDWTEQLDTDLRCECDDNAEHPDGRLEFWGTADAGSGWRVHLTP